MNQPLVITKKLSIPVADLSYEFSRAGGPGGQHVNTTDTRVRLRFSMEQCEVLSRPVKDRIKAGFPYAVTNSGDVTLTCASYRSRSRNVDEVRGRLAQMILGCLQPPRRRRKTRPTRASQRRRVDSKKKRGTVKKGRQKVRSDD